jgi:hypothetical protein
MGVGLAAGALLISWVLVSQEAQAKIRISLGSAPVEAPQPTAIPSPSQKATPIPLDTPLAPPDLRPVMAGTGPSPTPSITTSATPERAMTQAERALLLSEFTRHQRMELQALRHQQSRNSEELRASQKARQREWEENEKVARRKFFAENPKGPDRRAYILDFNKRRKDLQTLMKQEKTARDAEHDARLGSMKADQQVKLKEFKEFLSRGERPPESLWPSYR